MKPLKIAVFSGAVPSTTFIENLIDGVSKQHKILLFGVMESPKHYKTKNVLIYKTPFPHSINLVYTLYRALLLVLKRPKEMFLLLDEVKKYKKIYDKWIWFSKFLPIILYRPDVFHMQWARDLEFYWFLKTRFNIPVIVSLRGAHINYTPIVQPKIADIYKQTFQDVDTFHAVSKAIGLEAEVYGAQRSKINVIHSPIPLEFFDNFSNYNKHNAPIIKLLSVGRFHWKKGFSYVMDAVFELKEKGYQVEYTIIGPQDYTEALLFQINQLGINNQVKLKGTMPQFELLNEMKSHDMLILSSVEEGIANVVLEAMAIGLPVISTECGGMGEVVLHKKTGWLIPMRDFKAISNAVIDVYNSQEQDLQNITKNAHNLVKREFNAEDSINKFVTMYEDLCDI